MIESAKAIAANTDLETAQAFVFSTEDTYLGILISASADDIFTQVRQLSASVEENFFSSEENIPQRLASCLGFIKESLKEATDLKVLLCSFQSSASILYLQGLGSAKAYLLRDGRVTPLINAEQEGQLISGYIKDGDKVLILNDTADENITRSEGKSLEKLFEQVGDALEEEITDLAVNNPSSGPVAAILLASKPEQIVKVEAETIESIPLVGEQRTKISFSLTKVAEVSRRALSFLKTNIPKSRQGRLYLALGLLAILVLGIGFTIKNKNESRQASQFQAYLNQARDEYSQAQALKDLDADQAKEALNKSRSDLNSALQARPDNQEALNFKKELDSNSNTILKVVQVSDWPLFLDLNLIKESGGFWKIDSAKWGSKL